MSKNSKLTEHLGATICIVSVLFLAGWLAHKNFNTLNFRMEFLGLKTVIEARKDDQRGLIAPSVQPKPATWD